MDFCIFSLMHLCVGSPPLRLPLPCFRGLTPGHDCVIGKDWGKEGTEYLRLLYVICHPISLSHLTAGPHLLYMYLYNPFLMFCLKHEEPLNKQLLSPQDTCSFLDFQCRPLTFWWNKENTLISMGGNLGVQADFPRLCFVQWKATYQVASLLFCNLKCSHVYISTTSNFCINCLC